jgi:serine protease AprX
MMKIDKNLVSVLSVQDRAQAVVRVRSFGEINRIKKSVKVVRYYPFINSLGVECDMPSLKTLSLHHGVECVSAVMKVSALSTLEAEAKPSVFATNKLTGSGVVLAVIDTGIDVHTDICVPRNRIRHFVDFIGDNQNPYDDNGHGTFVTGIAVGNGICGGKTCVGVAPEAEVVGIKTIGANGESSTFRILDGMQWLYDNCDRYGIKVACMSFGAEPSDTADPLKIGAEMLVRRGITVVCAAGNNGENNLKSPAVSSEVISVGAVDDDDNVAKFSSYGIYHGVARPDVYAKGVKVKGIESGGTYSYMSGTSASAPMVAGACCLLHQKYKNLTPYQAKRLILSASRSKGNIKILDL